MFKPQRGRIERSAPNRSVFPWVRYIPFFWRSISSQYNADTLWLRGMPPRDENPLRQRRADGKDGKQKNQ